MRQRLACGVLVITALTAGAACAGDADKPASAEHRPHFRQPDRQARRLVGADHRTPPADRMGNQGRHRCQPCAGIEPGAFGKPPARHRTGPVVRFGVGQHHHARHSSARLRQDLGRSAHRRRQGGRQARRHAQPLRAAQPRPFGDMAEQLLGHAAFDADRPGIALRTAPGNRIAHRHHHAAGAGPRASTRRSASTSRRPVRPSWPAQVRHRSTINGATSSASSRL